MSKLVSSAIKFRIKDSNYDIVMCGLRHCDIFEQMFKLRIDYDKNSAVQGFWTSDDHFVDRRDAVYIARAAGQISDDFDSVILYSEDVWPERKFCENQNVSEDGEAKCLAHLAEERVLYCPYKNNDEREIDEHPCTDYRKSK